MCSYKRGRVKAVTPKVFLYVREVEVLGYIVCPKRFQTRNTKTEKITKGLVPEFKQAPFLFDVLIFFSPLCR